MGDLSKLTANQAEVDQILTESLQDITSDYRELLPQGWYATLQIRSEGQGIYQYNIDRRIDKALATHTRAHIHQLQQKTAAPYLQDAFLVNFSLKPPTGVSETGDISIGFAGAEYDGDNIFFAASMLKALLNYLRRDQQDATLQLSNLADLQRNQFIASALNEFRIPAVIEF